MKLFLRIKYDLNYINAYIKNECAIVTVKAIILVSEKLLEASINDLFILKKLIQFISKSKKKTLLHLIYLINQKASDDCCAK